MYQTSETFANKAESADRRIKTDIRLQGNSIGAEIRSMKYHAGCNAGDSITLGSSVSAYIDLTIYKPGIILQDKEIQAFLGMDIDGTMEWVPLGFFTVQKPKEDGEDTRITAFDRMKKLEKPYFSKLSYPTGTNAMLQEIGQMRGVPVKLPSRSVTFPEKPEGYTCREVVTYIAQMLGCFAIINRDGELELKWYQDVDYPLDTDHYWPPYERAEQDYSLNKLECAVGREEGEEGTQNKTLAAGAGIRGISFANPFMTQEALNAAYEDIKGFQFRPGSVTAFGDPRIEAGDVLTVSDGEENHRLPVMDLILEWDGGLSMEIEAVGNPETEESFDTKGPTAKALDRVYTELFLVDRVLANKVEVDYVEANFVKTERLESLEARIEDLDVTKLTARVAIIENAYIARAEVNTLLADYASVAQLNAVNAQITNISGELSTYKTQIAGQLTAFDADITSLKAKDAELETALIGTAKVTDLEAIRTRTQQLETDVAGINTLVNGNLTSDNIQSMVITGDKFTMENGFIKSAMIDSLAADKITGLDINTTKLTVHSNDGKSIWTDNTIQIADADRVRVQIGEDASGDYNIYIWDPSGNLMWNATGATSAGLNDGIIKDVAVAADANISGSKLDIESVIREVNGATTTIKGTRIKLDEQNQTLDAAFTSLKTYAEGVNSKTESNTTAISVAQGQISTLISNTTIVKDGQTVQLKDAFNSTVADVSSIKTTINEHTSLIDQQSGEIQAVTTKANTIESDLNGTKQTVSAVQSDLSGTKSRVSTVESGLDGLKSRVTATETSLSKKADGTTVDSLTSRVATAESTLDGFEASLTTTVQKVSANEKNISSHDTRITAAENAISLKVSTSDYNAYKTTVNGEIASAKSRLSTAESSITTMQGQIALKVSQTDIDTAVQNLEIGGRNLIINSSFENGQNGFANFISGISIVQEGRDGKFCSKQVGALRSDRSINQIRHITTKANESYAFSGWYKTNSLAFGTTNAYVRPYVAYYSSEGKWLSETAICNIPTGTIGWTYITATFKVPNNSNISYMIFTLYGRDFTGTIWWDDIKLEKGTKATDWSPAPEDIDASITAVDAKFVNYSTTTQMTAAITAAKDSITQSVSSTYATKASVDTVSGKVTNLTSRVQTAESKLTKDSLVTTIGSYYATKTYVDDLEIGGRNLIPNTRDMAGYVKNYTVTLSEDAEGITVASFAAVSTLSWRAIESREPIQFSAVRGKKVTCSLWVRSDDYAAINAESNRGLLIVVALCTGTSNARTLYNSIRNCYTETLSTDWKKITATVTLTDGFFSSGTGTIDDNTRFYVQVYNYSLYRMQVKKIKLEYGDKATDWTPAPEDDLDYIATVKTIATQTADKFNWLVKSGTSATDFTLTDRTATLVANAINLKGLVTFSGLDSAAQGKINTIDSINSFKFFTSNYSQPQSTLDSWAVEGKDAGNWTVVESTAGVRVGDMAAIRCYNTTTSAYVYILIKVTAISSATVLKGISHGYIDPNATAAAATAQSTANTANTTANTAKTNAATAQSTANTAKTNAATAQSTADAAKTAAANAQNTANTAKSTADAAKSWTDTNGANMVNLRNMVLKWTNNAVSTSTTIQGGWIATNTITAEKIALGDFTNYVTANESISTSVITGNNPFSGNLISGGYITKKEAGNIYIALTPYRVNSFDNNDELYYSFTIKSGKLAQCRIGIWFYGDGSVDDKTYKMRVLGSSHSISLNNEETFTGVLKLGTCKGYGYYAIGILDESSTKYQLFAKNVYVRKRSQGALIVDGSITAEKINVTSLSAISANLGTVTAGILKSANYQWTAAPFTDAGTYINLSNGGIWTKNFTVDGSGNAYIRGQVTATSGTIGGFTIGSTNLHNNTTTLAGAANSVYLGTDGISCGTAFKVTKAGALTATSGTIGNLTVSSTGLSYGALNFGAASFRLTKDTLSYGMFEVTKNGVTIGSSSTVTDGTGNLTVYDDLRFKDYSGSIRQPVASASADNARVAWVGSRISSGIQQFRVNGQWGTAGGAYTTLSFNPASSDIRLKENILPTEVEALPVLNSIALYQFDWRQDHYHQRIGFIADYLQTVDSNLAIGGGYDEDGNMDIKAVNDFYLLGYVVKGIQEICTWTANYAAETDRALTSVRADLDCTRNTVISNQQRLAYLEAQTQADNQSTQAQLASMQAQLQQALNRIAEQDKLIRQLRAAAG